MSLVDKLFGSTTRGLERSLDLSFKRNEAITSNIVNAETPGYRAMDVNFSAELKRAFDANSEALRKTSDKHLDLESSSNSHLVADYSGVTKPDGNNVDIDIQMGKMSLNAGKYSMGTSLVRKKLHMMRMAIQQSMR